MPTEIREHGAITDKLLAQHRYASRWFFVGTGDAAPSSFPNSLRSCGITAAAGYASVS
jgi:hypothetical protein